MSKWHSYLGGHTVLKIGYPEGKDVTAETRGEAARRIAKDAALEVAETEKIRVTGEIEAMEQEQSDRLRKARLESIRWERLAVPLKVG